MTTKLPRRRWIQTTGLAALTWPFQAAQSQGKRSHQADLVIIGASLGGCAAALAGLRQGLRVILSEETDWIGGQLTSQGVPPDEHQWIESHGANRTYRALRRRIRDHYRRHYPLTESTKGDSLLNPGLGSVSRLCHEPRVALAVLRDWMAPYLSSGQLTLLLEHEAVHAEVQSDRVQAITVRSRHSDRERRLVAPMFIDGTELGDLLPLTKTEYVTGSEGRKVTGELHGTEKEDPHNEQAFTMCFAMDHVPGEEHVIDKPKDYAFWRDHVPALLPAWSGKLLDWHYTHPRSGEAKKLGFNPLGPEHDGVVNLWNYRRIAAAASFQEGRGHRDISLVNWPQNDYMLGSLIDVAAEEKQAHIDASKQLSLSLLYWMQTEASRLDGGQGFPGLRLRPDIMGTEDGLAKYPYVRESRRIEAELTILESHCGTENRAQLLGQPADRITSMHYEDSVGIGSYPIDLHPSTAGDNYIDFPALPFELPLGALLPKRMQNLLPACKNIGSTHITNGCYRLHPVEWGIGEAIGCLAVYCHQQKTAPRAVRHQYKHWAAFQNLLHKNGVETQWPS
jgi:hypothetical protein